MDFGIKDLIDILIVATILFYIYRTLKESGNINVFIGVLAFVGLWVLMYKILDMRLVGTILDKFINIGLIVIVVLFQDQIKRFLVELGSQKHLRTLRTLFAKKTPGEHDYEGNEWIWPVVSSCMNMSKSKTGALIVVERFDSLQSYENTGDRIDANINNRLIENIFFKNSPLHDGALIIADNRLISAGCILPVSHNSTIPKSMGLRHRSALGITEVTDAIAIVVSEETGNLSFAYKGKIRSKLSSTELEHQLALIQSDTNKQDGTTNQQ